MSGDVQPRKRKDKRKKKEGGSMGIFHEPVSFHKFRNESEDQKIFDLPEQGEKIHVQNEHGMGGNIWVKIIFFCLLGLLVGAVGLIYMKSQGSSDVDLPTLEESRFADYFTGWLDDNTNEHEHEHDAIKSEHNDQSHEEDKPDDQEEMEVDEENENEEEDQSVEDPIFNLFGVQNDEESNEVQKTSTIMKEITESEESDAQKEVNEDEDDEDNGSEETEEEEINEDGNNENVDREELEKQNNDGNEISNESMNEDNNYGALLMEEYNLHQTDEEGKHQSVNKDKKYEKNQRDGSENDNNNNNDDDDDNEDEDEDEDEDDVMKMKYNIKKEEDLKQRGLKKEESDDEEEEKLSANLNGDDELGYKEIDISDEDLDELEIEPDDDMRDGFNEDETERSLMVGSKDEKPKELDTGIVNEEEEISIDAGGVAIKLGVGIALIIIAHLVLVQKWKSVSNAASDENTAFKTETAKGEKNTENQSSVEPVISRRQTLLPENIFFNDVTDNESEENESEDDYEEEEEDFEEDEDVCLEEESRKEECEKRKKDNWDISKEPLWKVKPQDNENENKADLTANEELEEELEGGDEEDGDGDGDEEDENGNEGDEDGIEEDEEIDEEEQEEEEVENEEDDYDENQF